MMGTTRPLEARMNDRPYDLVLYGATGFVGSRAAEYLAAHADAPRLRR